MQLLGSLLPGFREVRAPLVSGYLWLLFVWLLLEDNDAVPDRTDSDLYNNLFQLGGAVGAVGLTVVASVVAYVLGSLITQILRWAWHFAETVWRQRRSIPPWVWHFAERVWRGRRSIVRHWKSAGSSSTEVGVRLLVSSGYKPSDCRRADKTDEIIRGLEEIGARETQPAFRRLRDAAERFGARLYLFDDGAQVAVRPEGETVKVPRLSADSHVFAERGVILSRLMDVSAFSGSKIDRLHAESEFRFALAWPLLALIIAFAAMTGDVGWLALSAVPVLLIMHGLGLHRDASLELVDALRAQSSSDALASLTPAYQRYREDAAALEKALLDTVHFPPTAKALASNS